MQGMVANSAAHRIKKRCRKNVVEIHCHCGKQDQPVSLPVLFIVPVSNCSNGYKVKEVMRESLQLALLSFEVVG